jgi:hypothetical protein
MRPGQHNKRSRSRSRHRGGGGGGGNGGNPLSRVYESNGPDVKVRGTAQTIAEKYLQLGRDAQSSGDIVMAESYYQHAEHYLRIVAAAQAYNQQFQQQYRRPEEDFEEGEEGEEGDELPQAALAPSAQASAEQPGPAAELSEYETQERSQPQPTYRPPREFRSDQPQQQSQGSRERFKPRWQDRRERQAGGESREGGIQPREEEQPRLVQPAGNGQSSEAGQWEAPSFLRRPAAVPPAAAEAEGESAVTERKRYERRPRREKPAEAVESKQAEDVPSDTQAD